MLPASPSADLDRLGVAHHQCLLLRHCLLLRPERGFLVARQTWALRQWRDRLMNTGRANRPGSADCLFGDTRDWPATTCRVSRNNVSCTAARSALSSRCIRGHARATKGAQAFLLGVWQDFQLGGDWEVSMKLAVRAITHPVQPWCLAPCAQCGDSLVGPEWSEHVSERCVRHFWSCDACGYQFETTVFLSPRE